MKKILIVFAIMFTFMAYMCSQAAAQEFDCGRHHHKVKKSRAKIEEIYLDHHLSIASFFTQNSPLGTSFSAPCPIDFMVPRFNPVGIVSGGLPLGTQFMVTQSAIYQLSWNITVKNTNNAPQVITLQICEGKDAFALLPNPIAQILLQGTQYSQDTYGMLCGCTKLPLTKGQIISFQISGESSGAAYINPMFSIVEIVGLR